MAIVEMSCVKRLVEQKYGEAKKSIELQKALLEKYAESISNRIPGYEANKMNFGAYIQDSFVVLFTDMRNSTERAISIGPEKTFLTLHAIIPAMIYIVEKYNGNIIDLPGDGVMALFKNNNNLKYDGILMNPETLAIRSGEVLLDSIRTVINPMLSEDDIPPVSFGVGIDTGSVIVTKTGTDRTFDTKALGDCINSAAKKSKGNNEIWTSKQAYRKLPNDIQMRFSASNQEDNLYIEKVR